MSSGSHQWSGQVEAEVTDVNDPEERGRIKVNGRALTADGADVELDFWIPAKSVPNYGLHLPLRVGDIVEIEYTSGDTDDTAHGETFLRNPNFKYTGGVRRDKDDLDPEFRRKAYQDAAGYKEPEGRGGWIVYRESGAAAFWGRETVIGTSGVELGDLERAVGGIALSAWFQDLFTRLDDAFRPIYTLLLTIRSWGDPLYPIGGLDVVGPLARLRGGDYTAVKDAATEFDAAWSAIIEMEEWMGYWQHETVFFKDLEEGYEVGDAPYTP